MAPTDPWAIDILNPGKNVWWVVDTYPSESSAQADFDRWGGKVGGRPLRVRER